MDDSGMNFRLPEPFVRRVGEQLKEELPLFLSAMEQPPFRGLRMNPFRPGWEKPFRDAGDPVPWAEGGYELPYGSGAGVTVDHEAGAFYLQEPAAMLPAAVMNPCPGEKILDLCAAPGGKATQMGAALRGKGLLICNEPVSSRAGVLSRNLERMGIPNSIVTCALPERLAAAWPEGFDGVLADVPCSGEGMFRRHPETRGEWTEEKAAGCAARQRGILDAAAGMVRPGGRLVYSTCTWNPAENEEQIRAFLERHPEFEPEPFFLPGAEAPEGLFTCWLHRTRGEGQFTALLRKKGEREAFLPSGETGFRPGKEILKIWENGEIRTERPNAIFGQTLVSAPEIPDLKGIRVLRLGLHLGQVRGRVVLPDHAAALGMHRPDMPETELNGGEALKYLAGEAVPGDVRGWTLMTRRGLVLGWGKGSEGWIRNHYPKGLRNEKLTE
ncbi:MAG: RsmB/NOP family class I SAM-dependent RNA methyltransferase [Clostridiales bacterium]|nr:RsmB/NOP family class I SAM-dependent RNA methyltransferase [Clostridiales bacterium]